MEAEAVWRLGVLGGRSPDGSDGAEPAAWDTTLLYSRQLKKGCGAARAVSRLQAHGLSGAGYAA
jgi:hypothetical protein